MFEAIGQIPGVRDLGPVRDPLHRAGVAVATDRTVTANVLTVDGPRTGPVVHLRSELIFDPQMAGLLAQETLMLNPPHIPGISDPFATALTAYLTSGVVPQSTAPTLKQLGVHQPPPPALRPSTPPVPTIGSRPH